MELGDLDEALTVCDEGLTTWRVRNLFRMRASLLKELKRYDEVADTLDQAIREGIADDEMRVCKGGALIELKRFDAAIREFNDVLRHSQENIQARYGRAYCLCKIGKPTESTREIEQIAEDSPTDARFWYARAAIYADLADITKMLTSLEKAIQLEPELAQEAPGEEEFGPYRDLPEFEAIVKK
jgi:tetratricopeptide (TPR) repeat protein